MGTTNALFSAVDKRIYRYIIGEMYREEGMSGYSFAAAKDELRYLIDRVTAPRLADAKRELIAAIEDC